MQHRARHPTVLAALAFGSGLFAAACGGPQMRGGELYAGRIHAEPSLECLPDPDVVDEELTERMRIGLELAEASFAVAPPPPPSSRAALDLQEWANGPLRAWLARKTHAVEAARRELDAAADQAHRQRIIGGAVVGLMYEDVARVLRSVPAPDDLDDEPEILAIYRQILESQARPFLETARRAYHACALNARQPASMRHWSRFCSGRRDRLPERETPASGATEVDVLVD
jgi:hypothetical protein